MKRSIIAPFAIVLGILMIYGMNGFAHAATPACKLSLVLKTLSGNSLKTGSMSYELISKNTGDATCQTASISMYYAENEKFSGATPRPTARDYYWEIGNVAPGKEADISVTTSRSVPLPAGAATDEACLSADNGVDACSDAAPSAPSAPPVAVPVVTSPPSSVSSPPTPNPSPAPAPAPVLTQSEFGIWVWTPITQMTQADMRQVVNSAAASHFNVIYLTIDDYLDVETLPAGAAKQQQIASYEQAMNTFITLAAQQNVSVDAEAGWRDWVYPANQWKSADIMSFVARYNQSHSLKFRGVQYDIEPYLLPEYETGKADVLTQYVQMVENLVNADKNYSLPLSFDIPHFYDGATAWTPQVTADGISAYTYDHLLRLLGKLENSKILVMAYRNFAVGPNGTINLSQSEIQTADRSNVKVIVAQETGPVTPSYVTFSGLTKNYLFSQLAIINQTFASNPSFAGVAIDYLDPYSLLK